MSYQSNDFVESWFVAAGRRSSVTGWKSVPNINEMKKLRSELAFQKIPLIVKDISGRSALHLASAYGNTEVVQFLIETGVEVDDVSNNGWTALHAAAFWGYFDIVTLLISAGAITSVRDKKGMSPIEWAIRNNHQAVIYYLWMHSTNTLPAFDISPNTPLPYIPMDAPPMLRPSSCTRSLSLASESVITIAEQKQKKIGSALELLNVASSVLREIEDVKDIALKIEDIVTKLHHKL